MKHKSVLLNETIRFLDPKPDQNFIDATFGAGGHTRAILEKTKPQGRVLALDANPEAVDAKDQLPNVKGLVLIQGNFSDMEDLARENGFEKVAGILFDLGLSSDMLDDPKRGFSFQAEGPLDMRFDPHQSLTAEKIVNEYAEDELKRIFRDYGEERNSGRIVRAITESRKQSAITTTIELFELIKQSLPNAIKHKAADAARRIFQALRIEVNSELESLEAALPQAVKLLAPGGRLCVISFHSLEDRIVKRFFLDQARGCICPSDFSECRCGRKPVMKILTRKPVTASEEEIGDNSRAKPAKLRAAEKI